MLNSRDIKKSIFAVEELVQFHFVRLFYKLNVSEFRNFVSVPVLVAISFLEVVESNFLFVFLSYVPLKIF